MRKFLSFLVLFGMFACREPEPEVFLFSYFIGNGEDGLHLAFSKDGLKWDAINNNNSFLTPQVGKEKLMRDPCIIKGGDNKFHMVWTVGWNDKGIGYANSKDLIHWSEQKYIPVMQNEPEARNCWAPELFYDKDNSQYLIYWATTIPGKFPETDSTGDNGYNHRIYYTTTKDFNLFGNTKLLYDKGFNVIDATIVKNNESYVMFLKDETLKPEPEKNIRIAISDNLTGDYGNPSEAISPNWAEGPTVSKIGEEWIVYFDLYTRQRMGAVVSADLVHWKDISEKIDFPEGTRHGTVFKVRESTFEKLTEK